jgi:predicted translin family RNA/ssDNA-binding protein
MAEPIKVLREVTEKECQALNMEKVGRYWSLCEVLRRMYKLAETIDDPKARVIMKKVRIATVMAKRTNDKLWRYRHGMDSKSERKDLIRLHKIMEEL